MDMGLLLASAAIQTIGSSSKASASVAASGSIERQAYDDFKRAELGAIQDHNARVAAFREYEESVLISSAYRQDRSVDAILRGAAKASREELRTAQLGALGQQSLLALKGERARMDASAARQAGRTEFLETAVTTGLRLHELGEIG